MNQEELEKFMLDISSSKANRRMEYINKFSKHEYATYGGKIIKWVKADVIAAVLSHSAQSLPNRFSKVLPVDRMVDVVIKNLVNGMFQDRKHQSVVGSIASDLVDESRSYFIEKYIKGGRRKLKSIVNNAKSSQIKRSIIANDERKWNGVFYTFSDEMTYVVANSVASMVIAHEHSPVRHEIRIINSGRRRYKQRFLVMRDGVADWIRDIKNNDIEKRPHWLPIVQKPDDWVSHIKGGYPNNTSIMFTSNLDPNYPLSHDWGRYSKVSGAANHIQSIPHMVNRWVYKQAKNMYLDRVEFKGFPAWSLMPKPTWEECDGDGKVFGAKWRLADDTNGKIKKSQHKVAQCITVTGELLDNDLYLPIKSDFRGRLYTIPKDLSYQSGDMSKSLLSFKGDDATGGEEWIIRQMANSFGWDKKTIEERLTFVEKNTELIKNIATNPIDHLRDWEEASDPWQFAAACKEWESRKSTDFVHTLPIGMDASCNGLQILSILAGCEVGCKFTNVTPSDKPYDFYTIVLESVIKELESRNDLYNKRWLKFGLNRATVKTPTLSFPYGGTTHSTIAHVVSWYNDEANTKLSQFSDGERGKAAAYLANIITSSIYDNLPNVRWLMEWLKDVARLAGDQNMNIEWVSPSGMPIKQTCYDFKTRETKFGLNNMFRYVDNKKVSKRNHIKSIVPNFIHSIDSAILHEVLHRVRKHDVLKHAPISCVHDCYNTTAPYASELLEVMKESFIDVMGRPILEDLRKGLIEMGLEGVKDLPMINKIPLTNIMKSRYLFS